MARAFNATADEVELFLGNETGQLWRLGEDQSHCPVAEDERGWYWQTPIREEGFVFWDRVHIASPYQPGDTLYVRETFSTSGLTRYHDTGNPDHHGGPNDPCCAYAATATYKCGKPVPCEALATGAHKWKSSARMPRKHSRIDIEITAVAAKQVRAVTGDDAIAAGCFVPNHGSVSQVFINRFRERWNSLYAQRGLGWAINPWAWVFDWRRIKP